MQEDVEVKKCIERISDASLPPQQISFNNTLVVQVSDDDQKRKCVTVYWLRDGRVTQETLNAQNSADILGHTSWPGEKQVSNDTALYDLIAAKRSPDSELIPDYIVGYLRAFNAFLLSSAAAWSITYIALKIILLYLGLASFVPLWGECLITAAVTLAVGIYVAHEHHVHRLDKSEKLLAQNTVANRALKTTSSMKQKFLLLWDKIHTFLVDSYAVFILGGVIAFLIANVFGGVPISATLLIVGAVAVGYGLFSTAIKNSDSNKVQTTTEKLKGNFNLAMEKANELIERTKAPYHKTTEILDQLSRDYQLITELKLLFNNPNFKSDPRVAVFQSKATEVFDRAKLLAAKILPTQELITPAANLDEQFSVEKKSMEDMLKGIKKDIDSITAQSVTEFASYYEALGHKARLLRAKTLNARVSEDPFQRNPIQLIIGDKAVVGQPKEANFYRLQFNKDANKPTWQLFSHHNGKNNEIMIAMLGNLSSLLEGKTLITLTEDGKGGNDKRKAIEELLTLHRDQGEIASHVYDKGQFSELDKFEVIFGLFYGQFKAGAFVYIALPAILSLLGQPELSAPIFWGIVGGVAFIYGIIHAFYTAKSIQEEKWLEGDYDSIDKIYNQLEGKLKHLNSSSTSNVPEPGFAETWESNFFNMSTSIFVELEKREGFFADTAKDWYASVLNLGNK